MPGALLAIRKLQPSSVTGSPKGLKDIASPCGIGIGGVEPSSKLLNREDYFNLLSRECSILTIGLALKWDRVRPAANEYDFSAADNLLAWASSHGMQARGHTLVWHNALPRWFSEINRSNARELLVEHISTVVGHNKGKISSWDVVNEVVDQEASTRSDGLRSKPWLDLIGPEYLDLAFRTAAQADANAQLVLNQNGIEHDNATHEKRRALVLGLLQKLREKDVPIHALGIQSHVVAGEPFGGLDFKRFLSQVRSLGLKIILTEFDVNDTWINSPQREAIVAKTYADYLKLMLNDSDCKTVVFGCLTDIANWYDVDPAAPARKDGLEHRPGLFDKSDQPTASYRDIHETLVEHCSKSPRLGAVNK
jgi:endo-1,4-beta-xylanase